MPLDHAGAHRDIGHVALGTGLPALDHKSRKKPASKLGANLDQIFGRENSHPHPAAGYCLSGSQPFDQL